MGEAPPAGSLETHAAAWLPFLDQDAQPKNDDFLPFAIS